MLEKRRLLLAAAGGAVFALLAAALVGLPLALTHRTDFPLERAYGQAAVSLVARLLAGNEANPLANDPRALSAGRAAYTGSCGVCHGSSGDGRGAFGPGTYPEATDLTSDAARQKTDAELFWIVKNGLGFTAMPRFGDVYKDQDIWAMVSYIRSLQRSASRAIEVRAPTETQLLLADAWGDRVARGAAIYFAQGCHLCHGAEGQAPGDLAIVGRIQTDIVRRGDERGMPAYGPDRISDAELADLDVYLLRFAGVPSSPD
jgi:mono/diheme cytochrome c family protein